MTWPVRAALLGWSAWAPGVSSPEDWQAWARGTLTIAATPDSPPVDFIPAIQRRRLSRLSRLALAAAQGCAGDRGRDNNAGLPTVFASQHGEIHRTVGLLTGLASGEPLSPMAFSLSVHNTASGLYSIATGNTAPSTAIAAGRDTLAMALVEAVGQLSRHDEVMVVYAEEPLPAPYSPWTDTQDNTLLGLALRLGRSTNGRELVLAPVAAEPSITTSNGLHLLHWLAGDSASAILRGERHNWSIT